MKKLFSSLFLMLFVASFGLTSCSDDDNENGGNSSQITVNDQKFKVENSSEVSFNIDRETLTFDCYLTMQDADYLSMYEFRFIAKYISSLDNIEKGTELNVEVKEYRENTDIGSSYSYSVEGGKVIVEAISSNNISVKFDNFKFMKRSVTYTVNGIISYELFK